VEVIQKFIFSNWLKQTISQILGKSESLHFHLVRDTVGVMILKVTAMGLGFLINVFLARLLGAAGYGVYAYVWSMITFLSIPAAFGLPQLLVRNIASYQTKEEWSFLKGLLHFADRTVLVTSLILATFLGLGIWLFSDRIGTQTRDTFLIALLLLMFMSLLQIRQMSLQGLGRIVQGQMLMSFVRPILFILIASAYFFSTGRITPPSAMGIQVVASSTAFLIGTFLLKKYLPKPIDEISPTFAIGPWVRSAMPLLGIGILGVINTQADILLLGTIKGAEAVGIYKVALQNALLITFPLVAIKAVSGPTISSLHTKGNRELLQRVITYATRMAWLGSLPIALGFIVGGKWFLSFLFGQEFVGSTMALGILSLGYLINVTMGAVDLVLIMTEHEDMAVKGMGFAAVFNVILNTVFIPLWGPIGAAAATAISQACWSIILAMWVYKKLGINTTVVRRQIWRMKQK